MTISAEQERQASPGTAPITLEAAVAACFQRVLRCGPVDPDDSFFELGGDSLLALSLLIELEKLTGRELPLAALYDQSSVTALAAALQQGPPPFDPVVAFRAGTAWPPVFMVHGIFAGLVDLMEVAAAMPTDRAVYGLQPRGLDCAETPFEHVEEMAGYYLEAVTRRQPHGPYLLVGYSFGGLVALEMARQLQARGDSVDFLCFIDTYPNPRHWPWPSRLGTGYRRGRAWLRAIAATPQQSIPRLWHQFSNPSHRGLQGAANALAESGVALPDPLRRVRAANYRAFMRYAPAPYQGRVTFLRAAVPHQFPASPRAAWRAFPIDMASHTLPGDHYSMVRDNKRILADFLSACIESCRGT